MKQFCFGGRGTSLVLQMKKKLLPPKLKVMFLHLSVILFTMGGGVSLTENPWTETPWTENPLWTEIPPDREHPHSLNRNPPYGNERAVRILLEWILVKRM